MQCPFYDKLAKSNLLEINDDTTVGELAGKIERFFDLPEGTVFIRHPEKPKFNVTAKISTVRREWGYEK